MEVGGDSLWKRESNICFVFNIPTLINVKREQTSPLTIATLGPPIMKRGRMEGVTAYPVPARKKEEFKRVTIRNGISCVACDRTNIDLYIFI